MKTIGLIGGVTWESTLDYYRIINEEVARRLGGANSAKIALVSLNFHEVLANAADAANHREIYVQAARKLEQAGAEFLVICSNTAHRRADDLAALIGIPILHIADATGRAVCQTKLSTIGLVGTRQTMEGDFIQARLQQRFGLKVRIPAAEERTVLDKLIFGEMACGTFSAAARTTVSEIIAGLAEQGAEGVVLGCTELPILLRGISAPCTLFDTTRLHALAAVSCALQEGPTACS
jgi:amino-acid racemase